MNKSFKGGCLLIMLAVIPALGADQPVGSSDADGPKAQIEMHEKMVKAHQAAVDCLKSGKPVDACNAEAMKMCPMSKSSKCPFMKHGMKGMKGMKGMDMGTEKSGEMKK